MPEQTTVTPESDALLAATLLAIDPSGLRGACLHCRAGFIRDAWIAFFRGNLPAEEPLRRVPSHIGEDRLLGGLDLVETLKQGRPINRRGLLDEADQGFVLLPMAERMPARMRAHLTGALDTDEVILERDGITQRNSTRIGIIALDESVDDDESMSSQLLDRVAFLLDLSILNNPRALADLPDSQTIRQARSRLASVRLGDELCESLCTAAATLGIASIRPSIMAARAACALAALADRSEVSAADAQTAARLVLAPRATQLPTEPPAEQPPQETPPETEDPPSPEAPTPPDRQDPPSDDEPEPESPDPESPDSALDDLVLAAAVAAIPPKLLQQLAQGDVRKIRGDSQGRAGAVRQSASRGRPAGSRPGKPGGGVRLNLIETLRAAAPWQAARRAAARNDAPRRLQIRSPDLRVTRYKQRTQTTTIFVVDASGSSALNRLAEAKGAVELLLADCYVRRDQVSLIAFRGRSADLILPPTRSLLRAKRNLAGLPGGGGTPLAMGIQAGVTVAEQVRRSGQTATLVLLTDGCANIALDGTPGRERADADALAAARRSRAAAIATLLIDISSRGQRQAEALARSMNARYIRLPYADAVGLSNAIKTATGSGRR